MERVAEVDLVWMDIMQLEEPCVEKVFYLQLFNRFYFFLYLREGEKDIENPKNFSEEKEYYKPGEKAAQWSNYEKGSYKIYVLRSDSTV